MGIHWSTLELKILMDANNSFKDVCDMLGRTEKSIRSKARVVGRKFGNKWVYKNTNLLSLNLTDEEISKLLRTTISSVEHKRRKLKIRKRKISKWTTNEINIIKINIDENNKELAKALDRTVGSIQYIKRKIKRGGY